ncbi:hypothetical protein GQ55_9G456000 [Panicum hallii var. hallii]|uniref:Uncharacterized protein n=1 Tax=Panicum hallii var. hallii TaxID=1504633 RepID=A0A2T7CBZ3_9POAL|nr:hypothetical protein GQ55_9G456000 [Panicum hallii var. hallii]PUZ40855.1 hypothetical protein GQ55_9G456000 [Panicum hallii var. hallii]
MRNLYFHISLLDKRPDRPLRRAFSDLRPEPTRPPPISVATTPRPSPAQAFAPPGAPLVPFPDCHGSLPQPPSQRGLPQPPSGSRRPTATIHPPRPLRHPAGVVPEDVAHPVFDDWDEEVQYGFDSHGLLQQLTQWTGEQMQCNQVSLMASVMFEEMHQGGEDLIGKEKKATAEFSRISSASLPVELYVDSGGA